MEDDTQHSEHDKVFSITGLLVRAGTAEHQNLLVEVVR